MKLSSYVILCRYCNSPKPSVTSECQNCINKAKPKWNSPNSRNKGIR